MPRAQIKDERSYRKLRAKGESGSYDDWSKRDLMQRAKEIGIKGRSTMSKPELIKALRGH